MARAVTLTFSTVGPDRTWVWTVETDADSRPPVVPRLRTVHLSVVAPLTSVVFSLSVDEARETAHALLRAADAVDRESSEPPGGDDPVARRLAGLLPDHDVPGGAA